MAEEITNTESSNWYESSNIDQSLITDKVKTFTNSDGSMNLNEFVKSYNASQSYIGGAVKIPQENASESEINSFYTKLGRPEKYSDYDWKAPEGIEVKGEAFEGFKKHCHALGLTNKQMNGVLDGYTKIVQDIVSQDGAFRAEQEKNTRANLQREWGDKFEAKLGGVMKLFEDLGIKSDLEAKGMLYDERYIKAFQRISTDSQPAKTIDTTSASSIQERITALQKDPAYLNSAHPNHKAVVEEANNLFLEKAKLSR